MMMFGRIDPPPPGRDKLRELVDTHEAGGGTITLHGKLATVSGYATPWLMVRQLEGQASATYADETIAHVITTKGGTFT